MAGSSPGGFGEGFAVRGPPGDDYYRVLNWTLNYYNTIQIQYK